MADLNQRYYRKDIPGGKAPELMNVSELSSAFEKLSLDIQREKERLLFRDGGLFNIADNLNRQDQLWKTKAELISLEESFKTADQQSLNTVLSSLIDIMFFGKRSIRRSAAMAAGNIIAAASVKDISIWNEYLRRILFMKTDSLSSGGISEDPLRVIFLIVYDKMPDDMKKSVLNSYASYFKSTRWDSQTCLRLISGIFTIPVKQWGAMQRGNIGGFIRYFLRKDKNNEVRIASLFLLNQWLDQGWRPSEDFAGFLMQSFEDLYENNKEIITPADNVLIKQICTILGTQREISFMELPPDSVLFNENMRSDREWIFKLVNLNILKQRHMNAKVEGSEFDTYISQLMILLRLNPDEIVFQRAGEDILDFADSISDRQKYEMAKDLIKILETGYDETGYVPEFLGKFYGRLSMSGKQELIRDIRELAASSDPDTVCRIMETVCCILRIMTLSGDKNADLTRSLCGILSSGLYSDMTDMVSGTLFFLGYDLFAALERSDVNASDSLNECYSAMARSALVCMNSAIYPDIICHSDPIEHMAAYMKKLSAVYMEEKRPVAFFSSSFDPFSTGHRAIVNEIAEMGFQVYVNVHNFAWNRNMQPLQIRRQIAAMSVADVQHADMFPAEITINTENPDDLAALRALFPDRKVWLVIGSDRIENDEIYNIPPYEGSVHSFPHIIFVRNESSGYSDIDKLKSRITGECITLKLPVYYEHMTSREIRGNIQEGKSIDGLIGPQIRNYIERNNLYSDNRFFKPEVVNEPVETESGPDFCSIYLINGKERIPAGTIRFQLKDKGPGDKEAFITEYVPGSAPEIYLEILLDETMFVLQNNAVKLCTCKADTFDEDLLKRRGFISGPAEDVFTVKMDYPVLLFTDVTSYISMDAEAQQEIMDVAGDNARRLQRAVAELFPGNLVLTIISELLNYRLGNKLREVCSGNGQERICVPFGKILKFVSIPGVVTMPLNTEKRYDTSLENFVISEKSGYPSLQVQIRTVRSKNMPFILVDDLYHKGYRMDRILTSLEEEGIREESLVVGVISDRGKKLAEEKGITVDAVYEVPNLRLWINASDMIPFYGTDKIDTDGKISDRILKDYPSIYTMLPYQYPSFLQDAPYEKVYSLSQACIENAIRLFEFLERSYQDRYHKPLTYAHLSEVIEEKGYPAEAGDPASINSLKVSDLLKNELIRLKRLK